VRRVWAEFTSHRASLGGLSPDGLPFLRALVCNAGALLNTRYIIFSLLMALLTVDNLHLLSNSLSLHFTSLHSQFRTLTAEGVEVTFAAHLLFGTYLLGELALPSLKASAPGSRLVVVTSGGMYNKKFPDWEDAVSIGNWMV